VAGAPAVGTEHDEESKEDDAHDGRHLHEEQIQEAGGHGARRLLPVVKSSPLLIFRRQRYEFTRSALFQMHLVRGKVACM
jgi:hypothetical protein